MSVRTTLEGRPFGHPLHPLLSHVPLGLWLLGLGLDVTAVASTDRVDWAIRGAYYVLLIGSAVAIITLITGINDFLDIREDHPAQRSALFHMALMIPATLLFIFDVVVHYGWLQGRDIGAFALALSSAGYVLALIGGYLGGLLVYDHGIAVGRHRRLRKLPQNTIHEPRAQFLPEAGAEIPAAQLPVTPAAPGAAALGPDFYPVVPESALPEGATLRVEVEGYVLVLVRAQGRIFAVQEFCTHRCGPLSEGTVHGINIQCPWHNSCFDLSTGEPTHGPAKVPLKTFETAVRNGIIQVRIAGAAAERAEAERAGGAGRRNPPEPVRGREEGRPEQPRRTTSDKP
ncbi:MAG TPA: DUF2231 domain-containing protein [Phycisphaerae bacterium]|nr:DUF2231 domain-containing protein [Phycisphaerae bacterium]